MAKRGRPPGSKNKATIAAAVDKELLREELRRLVRSHLPEMTNAQISAAKGIQYLVARHQKSGKFVHLTKGLADDILSGKNREYEAVEVWEKLPSTPAYSDLLNRTIDKPAEQEQKLHVTVEHLDERIRAARKRVGR